MQPPDHVESQRTLAGENFIDAIQAADGRYQILRRQPGLLHAELDGFHRIGMIDGEVFGFVGFDQRQQYLKSIAILRAGFRFVVEIRRYLAQSGLVVSIGMLPETAVGRAWNAWFFGFRTRRNEAEWLRMAVNDLSVRHRFGINDVIPKTFDMGLTRPNSATAKLQQEHYP